MALWNLKGNVFEIARQMSYHSMDTINCCNLGCMGGKQCEHEEMTMG